MEGITTARLICPKCSHDFGTVTWVIVDLNAGVQIMKTKVPSHNNKQTGKRCEAANTPYRMLID